MAGDGDLDLFDLTMEEVLHGDVLPNWLLDTIVDGNFAQTMIIYPNELLRNRVLVHLADNNVMADTTLHSTYSRFVDLLHLDSGKEARMDADGPAFSAIHTVFSDAASKAKFPLLHSIPDKKWPRSKTERVLKLLREIKSQGSVSNWRESPGLDDVDRVLKALEKKINKIHSINVESAVVDYLEETQSKPFCLSSLQGILILSHEPDFSSQQRKIFNFVRRFTPIHLMSSTGSYIEGLHGAWINDIFPITSCEEIPSWLPQHDVFHKVQENIENYLPPRICKLDIEDANLQFDATLELVSDALSGSEIRPIVVIDPGLESRREKWRRSLASLGQSVSFSGEKLSNSSAVNAILSHVNMPKSNDAWSYENIVRIAKSNSLPLLFQEMANLSHPSIEDIVPTPHLDVLENISRNFHIKGGISTINQWFTALEIASPEGYLGDYDKSSRRIEETQWWLANIAMIWWPLIPKQESEFIVEIIGNFSKQDLPLLPKSKSCFGWYSRILKMVDWSRVSRLEAEFDNSTACIQHLSNEINRTVSYHQKLDLLEKLTDDEFPDLLSSIADNTKAPNGRVIETDVQILTPKEAMGMKSGLVILAFMDVESWSMKQGIVPWLDNESRSKLGLPLGDYPLRQSRYYLANIVSSFEEIIALDTSEDEGVGPCAPFSEFLDSILEYNQLPSFMTDTDLSKVNSPWEINSRGVLSYSPTGFVEDEAGQFTKQGGRKLRNQRQRLGLALRGSRDAIWIESAKPAILSGMKEALWQERINRHPQKVAKNETMPWESRQQFSTTKDLHIYPSGFKPELDVTVSATNWPNLGGPKGNSHSIGVDPRPLPNYSDDAGIFATLGAPKVSSITKSVWSASRLESWLKCPRKAWLEKHLTASLDDDHIEDVDFRTRGDILHKLYETMFSKLGVMKGNLSDNPLKLSESEYSTPDSLWALMLDALEDIAPWLTRKGAVTHHRCMELCGCTPGELEDYWSTGAIPEIGGKIGKMVIQEFHLMDCAPLASEWSLSGNGGTEINALNDEGIEESFTVNGYIDRIDEIILKDHIRSKLPEEYADTRFVVIRDIKSIQGPKVGEYRKKHESGILSDLQLAIYSQAFENQNPGFKVIAAGISQIGDSVTHFLEADSEFSEIMDNHSIGEITNFTINIFRFKDSEPGKITEHFPAWKQSRLTTALRAINTAKNGQIHPTPGPECKYCSVADMCGLQGLGGI